MISHVRCLVLFVVVFTGTGCYREKAKDPTHKWDNIHRVFMNQSHTYTFMIKDDPESKESRMVQVVNHGTSCANRASPRIIEDVPKGEMMWASAKVGEYSEGTYLYNLEIHIHNVKDIEPGGWQKREGKTLQKGQNSVIE